MKTTQIFLIEFLKYLIDIKINGLKKQAITNIKKKDLLNNSIEEKTTPINKEKRI